MTLLLFIIVFGIVIMSHELGHFLIARMNGIHVVEFMIGMGPKIFSWKKGDTLYSLRMLPIGGACLFEGEDGLNEKEGDGKDAPGAFPNASIKARIATVAAGPFFNFILALLVAVIMVPNIQVHDTVISEVVEGSAAEDAELLAGDKILSVNGEKIYLFSEIYTFTQMNKGATVDMLIERDGSYFHVYLTPKKNEEDGNYYIGIVNSHLVEVKGLRCIQYGWYEVRAGVKNTYKSLLMLITGKLPRQDVAGPVGMAHMVGEIYEETKEDWRDVFVNMLNLTMLISVSLGIMNILPLPALDGGRLVFLIVELFRGKPVPPEKEGLVHFVGLVFFMILMVVVLFNDISNILHIGS
ncbi:MAG: RIP metalloprotease RseP [Lachnospiraceae bacterium]|nr:RIP metalloprotease RseP [Lachnospiraceae bacterium]